VQFYNIGPPGSGRPIWNCILKLQFGHIVRLVVNGGVFIISSCTLSHTVRVSSHLAFTTYLVLHSFIAIWYLLDNACSAVSCSFLLYRHWLFALMRGKVEHFWCMWAFLSNGWRWNFKPWSRSSEWETIILTGDTGIRGLARGLATVPTRCNQEPLLVIVKDGRPKRTSWWCTASVHVEALHFWEVFVVWAGLWSMYE